MSGKIGLLVEGGGMKCAFSAGVLDVFLDNNIMPDICYGISAGAANSASFVAKQRGRNRRFYVEFSSDPEYFGFRNYIKNGSLFGLEYVYGDLSNTGGKSPLDYEALMDNPCELIVVSTDEHGNPVYFDKSHMEKDNYDIVKASSALPGLCQPIDINGVKYFDGGVSDSLPIDKMIEDGCDKFIVLFSKPRGYVMKHQKYRHMYAKKLKEYPEIVRALDNRHIGYNQSMGKIRKLEKEGRAFTFCPSPIIPFGTYKVDGKMLAKLYDNGVDTGRAKLHRLREFINKD